MHAPLRLSTLLVLFLLACAQFTVALLSFPQVNTKREAQPGDGYGGAGFTVQALFDEQPATVIMLHGLGGNGREWAVLSLGLSIFSLNYVKFIIPSAENASVTYLNSIVMPSWYDILFIRGTVSEVDEDDLLKSVARVNRIIDGEIAAGVPADRIFLVGFSQGGGLALSAFLRSKTVLGGCIGVATWLPRHEDFETFGGDVNVSRAIQSRDVQMIHGTEDVAVSFDYAQLSADRIRQTNVTVNFTSIPGEGHVILNQLVIDTIEMYIVERAPGTTQFLKTMIEELTDTFEGDKQRFLFI